MSYLMINGTDVSDLVKSLKPCYETLVSDKSGRNANGDTVVDVINKKVKLQVTFRYMTDTEMANLLATFENYVINVTYRDVKTNSNKTITCYTGTPEPEYYCILDNRVLYKEMSLNFIIKGERRMVLNSTHSNMLISPARSIAGKVELYESSTLLNTFKHTDALSSFTVSRAGDKKFFGFGVCQEIEVKLVDRERAINIQKEQNLKVSFVVNNSTVSPTPLFYVSEVTRDENTNELTIKAYDIIHKAKSHTVSELNLEAPYTISDVANAIVGFLGISLGYDTITREAFNTEYPTGANFEGTETLREVLDDIAEATQTIYFMNNSNVLIFKHLKKDADPVLTIRKADYFELESKENRTLAEICSATELGDNVTTATGNTGETQYVRDNSFWELREDIATLLNNAIALVGGISLAQFNCKWRGNYLVEPGDKIALVTKDDSTVISYLLDEKYTYDGGFLAETNWGYNETNESADNPTTIGDSLKQTYAKVDKANKKIDLFVSALEENTEAVSSLALTSENITAYVSKVDNEVTDLAKEVNTKMSAEDVNIVVQTALGAGVDKVVTSTGFTFNEEGLKVSKSNSEITTLITENGMSVNKDNTEVLTANNLGVKAEDLHATTYLIIGNTSRFEDYGNRTGCFWIKD